MNNTGLVTGQTPGTSDSVTASQSQYPVYGQICLAAPASNPCPIRSNVGVSAPGTVFGPDHSVFLSQNFSVPTPNANILCKAGYSGWDRQLSLQIATASGQYLTRDGVVLSEVVTVNNANPLNLPTTVQTGTTTTAVAGAYIDEFFFCSNVCKPGQAAETDASQAIQYGSIPVAHTNFIRYFCNKILFNGQ